MGSDLRALRSEPPGIVSLGRVLLTDTRAVEADLAEHYGVSLTDDALTLRRLVVLVSQLPDGSRVVARGAGLDSAWSIEREQLATISDLVYQLIYVTVAAHGGRRATQNIPPWSFPRPGGAPAPKVEVAKAHTRRGFRALDEISRDG